MREYFRDPRPWRPKELVLLLLTTALAVASPNTQHEPAPHFTAETLNGATVKLHEYQGQPVLLFFGRTACPHCLRLIPALERLDIRSADRLKVFFVAVRQDLPNVLDFFYGKVMTYDVIMDSDGMVSTKYRVETVPQAALIDPSGRLVYMGSPEPLLYSPEGIEEVLSGRTKSPQVTDLRPQPPLAWPGVRRPNGVSQVTGDTVHNLSRRFIVDLDEPENYAKSLSQRLRNRRRNEIQAVADRIGARIVHPYGRWKNRIVLEIEPHNFDKLRQLPNFKHVREDKVVHALTADTVYQTRANYAWANAISGQGVNVCVVDTGVDYTHPDLRNKVTRQVNYFDDNDDAMDDNGHGTHVAGIIAGQGNLYRGLSYDANILAARCLGPKGDGYESDVVLAIEWCVEEGAHVINLSLGAGLYSDACDENIMSEAVNAAVEAGVVVACASGNDGNPNGIVAPACASGAIAVGAVDKMDNLASYSDGGKQLALVAPGGEQFGGAHYPEIVSAFSTLVANDPSLCFYFLAEMCYDNWFAVENNLYMRCIGTSMAAPHVAAAAALLLERNPTLTPAQIRRTLEQNADDLGEPGWDNLYGWGRINIEKALDNVPLALGQLSVNISDPNINAPLFREQPFDLAANIDCLGGDGCGEVQVFAQLCQGRDCSDFIPIDPNTPLTTTDHNPVELGALSGATLETRLSPAFDVEIVWDISEDTYTATANGAATHLGSDLATEYRSEDLEPDDGIGAIDADAQKLYDFTLPPGVPSRLRVQMKHYLVLQWEADPAGWRVQLADAQGQSLGLVGECIPISGGGGEPPSPDCWFETKDPAVLSQLNSGGLNHLLLTSFGVDEGDWLTFKNIYVIVDYEIDPDNDWVYRYLLNFDLSGIDPELEVTAARLLINVLEPQQDAIADVFTADNTLTPANTPQQLFTPDDPNYSSLLNPVKSFTCNRTGAVSINLKAVVNEAILARQSSVAIQLRERNDDQLVSLAAFNHQLAPVLTISQKLPPDAVIDPGQNPGEVPEPGVYPILYDTTVTRDVSENTYTKQDAPGSTPLGSTIAAEYSTGNLETESGLGTTDQDAEKVYSFTIPDGQVDEIRVRVENYFVLQFEDPDSGWYIFISDPNGSEKHLIGDCLPPTGGGGEPPPPDCWYISRDPAVLADLNPGGENYIKLQSHDVGENDWLAINAVEVIVSYAVDPENDSVHRYYVRFDVSSLTADSEIDSAVLGLYVEQPTEEAMADIYLVDNRYDVATGGYTIYNAEDAPYSNLKNPFKSIALDTPGRKRINVKPAVEDAVESGMGSVAFLIVERQQNQLVTLGGSTGNNAPTLDVYLKSGLYSALAKWTLQPREVDEFTLRVEAISSEGTGAASARIVRIIDPDRPTVYGIECLVEAAWVNCTRLAYGDRIEAVRVDAADPQQIPKVRLTLRNVPDNTIFIDADMPYVDGLFVLETDITLLDSGDWEIVATATDDDDYSHCKAVSFQIPWGRLQAEWIGPTDPVQVAKGESLIATARATCIEGECPGVKGRIEINGPMQIQYDDGSAEDYASLGLTDGYLAVKITPDDYPARLKTVRIYVTDTTTYPFELHIWDDKGATGTPHTELMLPRYYNPVAPTVVSPVGWYDIDVSNEDIVVSSGSVYLGWRQLTESQTNWVGFDTSTRQGRSWAYHPLLVWLTGQAWSNLDWLCDMDPGYCGNIMIRGVFEPVGYFHGDLPARAGVAPLYTSQAYPADCGDLDAGQTCEQSYLLHAVGPAGDRASVQATFANTHAAAGTTRRAVSIEPPATPCTAANLDAVGPVNLKDFAVLVGQWTANQPPIFADIDGSGTVDMADLAAMAQWWLEVCP